MNLAESLLITLCQGFLWSHNKGPCIYCMHVCQTERDWMCVILKGSTTFYYGILGPLDKTNQLIFCMLTLYVQNWTIIKGGKFHWQITPKGSTVKFDISCILKCISFCFIEFYLVGGWVVVW